MYWFQREITIVLLKQNKKIILLRRYSIFIWYNMYTMESEFDPDKSRSDKGKHWSEVITYRREKIINKRQRMSCVSHNHHTSSVYHAQPSYVVYIITLLFLAAVLITNPTGTVFADDTARIVIACTGEENGYIEPCGCSEGQLGGMRRRFEFLKTLNSHDNIILKVSLGDIIDTVNRQNEIKMQITLKALNTMGYIAHNIGEKDIAAGIETLHYLAQISAVPLVSSNVKCSSIPGIQIEPFIIEEIEIGTSTLKVAFLGILSPDLAANAISLSNDNGITISDPVAALKPVIARLKAETDLIVLLAHAERSESIKIAESCSGIDLIVTGHEEDEPVAEGGVVNGAAILPVGLQGKHISVVTYMGDHHGIRLDNADVAVDIVALGEGFNKPSEMDGLMDEYKAMVKDEDLMGNHGKMPLSGDASYTGSVVCGTCHADVMAHWEETKHARAYKTLQDAGSAFDPECVLCHTVGFNYSTGFRSAEKTPALKGVGCEGCHGPGNIHSGDPTTPYGAVGEDTCIDNCHDTQNSPAFQYEEYWGRIRHPK